MMTKDEIKTAFDTFIEFPAGSDGLFVTTTSTLIFAEHVAGLVGADIARLENELLAATIRIDNDTMRLTEMAEQLDIQAGSIEAVQAANVRLATKVEGLTREQVGLALDAQRYRFMTRHIVDSGDTSVLEDCFAVLGDSESCTQHEFDAAIDNAMKGESK